MTSHSTRIGKNLKAARTALGLSQQQVAIEARVSVGTVAKYEQGKTENPRGDEFERVAAAVRRTGDQLRGVLNLDDDDDDPGSADSFRAELARRYGHENADFVDEVATKIKDFPARDAALVRLLLLGAVRAADPRPRGSPDGLSEIGNLARVNSAPHA